MRSDNKKRHVRWLVEYDGSCFHGWQSQRGIMTVQDALEGAWQTLMAERISLVGSSRTDGGVHAKAHVSDFYTNASIPSSRIARAINSELPDGVAVIMAEDTDFAFCSRKNARGKCYRYTLSTRDAPPTMRRNYVAHVKSKLDYDAMQYAASQLICETDFTSMMDQGSPRKCMVRQITKCEWDFANEEEPTLIIEGDGFLYHMVRIMAGTLIAVGQGKIEAESLKDRLQAKNRLLVGKTMPATGLCLERVYYDEEVFGVPAWQPGQGGKDEN